MTVYVDNMRRPARPIGYRGRPATWSHMLADNHEELEAMARALCLSPAWLQHPGTHREHYDVTDTVRRAAIRLGAIPISYPRDTAKILDQKRRGV